MRGPVGLLTGGVSLLFTCISVVQFISKSGSGWMWISFALTVLVVLSFWRFHELWQSNQTFETQLVGDELAAACDEARAMTELISRDGRVELEIALARSWLPPWKDKTADYIETALGKVARARFLGNGEVDAEHARQNLLEISENLASYNVLLDNPGLEQAGARRRDNEVARHILPSPMDRLREQLAAEVVAVIDEWQSLRPDQFSEMHHGAFKVLERKTRAFIRVTLGEEERQRFENTRRQDDSALEQRIFALERLREGAHEWQVLVDEEGLNDAIADRRNLDHGDRVVVVGSPLEQFYDVRAGADAP